MADFRRRAWTMGRRPPIVPPRPVAPPRMIDEEFTPSSGRIIDSPEFHYLLIDLPGYKMEDINVSVDESGAIVVKGRRRKEENRQEHFEKKFDVLEDGDSKNLSMEFDGETLRVRVPKVAKKANGEDKKTDEASSSNVKEEDKKESNIPALSSSSPTKEDKLEEPKSPASYAEEENKVQSVSPDSSSNIKETNGEERSPDSSSEIKETNGEEKSPDSSSEIKETNGVAKSLDSSSNIKETNGVAKSPDYGITEDKAEVPPPSIDTTSSDTKEDPALSSHAENGKQKEPEIPKKVDTKEKPDDRSQGKDRLRQGEKSSQTSVMGKIVENKGILLASIISFTLGVLLSQKFHPPPPR